MKISIRRRRRIRAKRRKVTKEAARLLIKEASGNVLDLFYSPQDWSPELAKLMHLSDYYLEMLYKD